MTSYFDHNAKATSWEVVQIEDSDLVTESKLTHEDWIKWTLTANDFSKPYWPSPASSQRR